MSDSLDERIARLLNADAPASRDPMFRIALLERRERMRYRRRAVGMTGVALALFTIASVCCVLQAQIAETAGASLLSISLVSVLLYAPEVMRIVRHHWRNRIAVNKS